MSSFPRRRRLTFSRLALGVALGLAGLWLLAMAAAPVLFCLKLLGLI